MRTLKKKIAMIVEKTDTGFSAYSENHPIFTTAQTLSELMSNAYEAVNLFYEDQKIMIAPDCIYLEIDFKQFFQYYKVLNSKFLAQKIGMNPTLLSQYVQGRKKPSHKQSDKILRGIHQIGRELSELKLLHTT
jgi:transcriptional regulator with XRE-family HTH domain